MSNIILPRPRAIWTALPGSQTLFLQSPTREVCFAGTRGPGKSVSLETKVLTDSGWKNAGQVLHSDLLVAKDGSYCKILGIFPQISRPLYNVMFHDGEVVECDDDHRWLAYNATTGKRDGWRVKTTKEIRTSKTNWSIPYLNGALPGKKWEGLDPYMIGYIIANGTTGSDYVTIYSIDDEILSYAKEQHGWNIYSYEGQTARRAVTTGEMDAKWRHILGHYIGDQKFVPKDLLEADPSTRLSVLQGLMDGDGNYEKGAQSRYSTVSEQLAKDVVYLVKSLGGWATYGKRDRIGKHYETINGVPYNSRGYIFHVNLSHHNLFNPFRLQRKAERVQEQKKFLTRGIKSVTFSRDAEAVCFSVDHPEHCFVIGDFVVTHNTDAMLMSFAQYCGRGYEDFWRGVIFRRNYKHLDDIIAKSKRWFNRSAQKPRFLAGSSSLKWVWPTGEELLLRAFEDEEDYWSYHGHEYPFVGWEELTSWSSIGCYESMKSTNRSSFQPTERLPYIPRIIRSSTNPYGVGHNWVKNYFIDPAPYGKVIVDPKGNKRVCIFGSIKENPYLGEEYVQTLESITDPNKRKAWLEGSWDITSGGMFDDIWDATKHILKPFKIPMGWKIDRSFDWGSSRPFSVGWWAQTDGTDAIMADGTTRSFPRKTLIRIGEWYGTTGKPNEGVRMTAKNVAIGIRNKEAQMGIQNRVNGGPADSAIYAVTDDASIGQNMESEGVFWTLADKKAGSRKNGWELMRDRFGAVVDPELVDKPGLYVFETCRDWIRTVPPIPRDLKDPDDVDCFVAGTLISCLSGQIPIEQLKEGDYVNTPIGPRKLLKAGVAGVSPVISIGLSDGRILRGTHDHKIYVENTGLRPLSRLLLGDTLTTEEDLSWLKRKFTMGSLSDAIQMLLPGQLHKNTSLAVKHTLNSWDLPYCTELSGNLKEDQSQKAWMSTTKTTTHLTMSLRTLNYVMKKIMLDTICKKDLLTVGISEKLLMLGEKANKDKQYLEKILKSAVKTLPSENLRAFIVATILQRNIQVKKPAYLKNARSWLVGLQKKRNNVLSAGLRFLSNLIPTKKSKLVVISVDGNCAEEKVYYLTVDQAHLFYANGVLSTNTDAEDHAADDTRYRVLALDAVVHKVKIGGA